MAKRKLKFIGILWMQVPAWLLPMFLVLPDISLGALKTKLFLMADDEGKAGKDEYYGHGFVNAARASCME
jgi:hypothetical protein